MTYGDATDILITEAIRETAKAYRAEFNELKLDAEWSGVGYADLSDEERERISWSEFHDAVQGLLDEK